MRTVTEIPPKLRILFTKGANRLMTALEFCLWSLIGVVLAEALLAALVLAHVLQPLSG